MGLPHPFRATFDSVTGTQALGNPKAAGLCTHRVHLLATSDCVSRSKVLANPRVAGRYIATRPTCGPFVIVIRALRRCGPPRR